MASDRKFDVAALCSILCPGLGQVVKGEFPKGAAFFVGSAVGCFPIFWPWSVIDAYNHDPAAHRARAAEPAATVEEAPVSTGAYKVLGLTVFLLALGFVGSTASGGLSWITSWLPWWSGLFPAAFGGTMIYQAFQVEVQNRRDREKARTMRVEREILQLATKKGGCVSSVDVATNCGATLDEARDMLDRMAKKGHVGVTVRDDGVFLYRILDLPAAPAPPSPLIEDVRRAEAASPPLPEPAPPAPAADPQRPRESEPPRQKDPA